MPEPNSIPAASNPVGRYPDRAPGATPKPKLVDCLREALRSRHNEFLGLPPLNSNPEKYPQDWKEIMKSIIGRERLDG
jgi:hypothetical protein